MVRSMFSGVSGMRSHQTRMDVIGNNIANVNTYGFKASRATFRDIYYQSTKNASKGTAAKGGVNPSSVGVGTQTASIDVLQQRSTFTQTDYSMDVAIDGEGFFQIQDAEGNKYYTRAGQLNFDSAGNLVDALGNFVLGVSGNPIGKAADSKIIQLNAGTVTPAASSCTAEINGVKYTIAASTQSDDGNVAIQFGIAGAGELAVGQKLRVDVTSTSIAIYLNPDETFTSLNDLQTEMNAAIREACIASTGKEHPGGTFTITASEDVFPADGTGLTGQEIVGNNFGTNSGKINDWTLSVAGGFLPTGTVSSNFGTSWTATPSAMTDFRIVPQPNATDPTSFNVIATIDNKTYQGTIGSSATSGGKLWLYGGDDGTEYFEVNYPSFQTIKENCTRSTIGSNGAVVKTYDKFSTTSVGQNALMSAEKTVPPDPQEYSSNDITGLDNILTALGGAAGSELKLTLNNTFGKIWPNNGTFSSMTLDPNGAAPDSFTVTVNMSVNGSTIPFTGTLNSASNGTLTLSNSATGDTMEMSGLPSWTDICNKLRSTSYDAFETDGTKIFDGNNSPSFALTGGTVNTSDPFIAAIFQGLGGATAGASQVTLGGTWPHAGNNSAKITGMTVEPQAFTPPAAPTAYDVTVSMTDDTGNVVTFTGVFNGTTPVQLTDGTGATLDFAGLPNINTMNNGAIRVDTYNTYAPGGAGILGGASFPINKATVTNTPINPTATASAPSDDIGLGSTKFNLTGGTGGGIVGMEDLTSVAIGTDGTITAEHPTIGTIYIGRIDLVTFTNPQALIEAGSTYFEESLNSGNIKYCKPGTGGSGQLVSGSLELSNADLSKEFTDMITTQRGFQANSRVITVSDTMLEELVNLKR